MRLTLYRYSKWSEPFRGWTLLVSDLRAKATVLFWDLEGEGLRIAGLICSRSAAASSGGCEEIEMYLHHGFHEVR